MSDSYSKRTKLEFQYDQGHITRRKPYTLREAILKQKPDQCHRTIEEANKFVNIGTVPQ